MLYRLFKRLLHTSYRYACKPISYIDLYEIAHPSPDLVLLWCLLDKLWRSHSGERLRDCVIN